MQSRADPRGGGGGGGGALGVATPLSYMVTPPLLLNSPSPFPAFCIGPKAPDSTPPPPPPFVSGLKRTAPPRISYGGSQPPLLENPVSAPGMSYESLPVKMEDSHVINVFIVIIYQPPKGVYSKAVVNRLAAVIIVCVRACMSYPQALVAGQGCFGQIQISV